MVRRRIASFAALFLFACLCANATSALGSWPARVRARHHGVRFRSRPHHASCAKRSSFHAGGKPTHRRRRRGCGSRPNHRNLRAHGHHSSGSGRSPQAHRTPAAAHSSSCPDADLRPSEQNLERVRVATFCLVNRERSGRGEPALSENAHLTQSAQAHSEDMAFGDYFEHVGPHGDTPISRMRAAGYFPSSNVGYEVGENIAWGTLWLATPRAIVDGWMASPGHRENILDARFRDGGIGISPHPLSSLAHGQAGAMYTQDFGVITH